MPAPLSPLIQSLPATVPFVGPEAQERERGRPFRARIGANESVFGPSPKAIAAMQAAAGEAWMYGDPEIFELKGSLAARLGMRPENVAVGGGIDGLLGDTVRLFVEPGAAVVTSAGAYPTFNYHVQGFGGRLVTVPYRDDYEDPDSLLAAVDQLLSDPQLRDRRAQAAAALFADRFSADRVYGDLADYLEDLAGRRPVA